jgi:hypothetical protein
VSDAHTELGLLRLVLAAARQLRVAQEANLKNRCSENGMAVRIACNDVDRLIDQYDNLTEQENDDG